MKLPAPTLPTPPVRPVSPAPACRFAIAVWPQTASQAWRAELTSRDKAAAQCFERPIDLLLYLTELPGQAPALRPPGLR